MGTRFVVTSKQVMRTNVIATSSKSEDKPDSDVGHVLGHPNGMATSNKGVWTNTLTSIVRSVKVFGQACTWRQKVSACLLATSYKSVPARWRRDKPTAAVKAGQ